MEMVLRLHLPLWLTKICGNVKESGQGTFFGKQRSCYKEQTYFLAFIERKIQLLRI